MSYEQMEVIALLGIFLIAGLICAACALWFGWRDYRRARTWCVVEAAVIGNIEKSDIDGSFFRAVLEFSDVDGQVHRVRSSAWHYPPYAEGRRLKLCYEPGNPNSAQIIGEIRWALLGLGAAGLAFAFVAGKLIVYVLSHR